MRRENSKAGLAKLETSTVCNGFHETNNNEEVSSDEERRVVKVKDLDRSQAENGSNESDASLSHSSVESNDNVE